MTKLKILGIETSCDETAAAVVEIDSDNKCTLLSNVVATSMDLHAKYGGVVPEIAARSHIEFIMPVIDKVLVDAFGGQVVSSDGAQGAGEQRKEAYSNTSTEQTQPATQRSAESANSRLGFAQDGKSATDSLWENIDGIAVTYGAGLGGSLLVGVMTARTLAIAKSKPLYAINHVEGHVYANFITDTSPALATDYHLPTTAPKFPCLALVVSGGHSQLVLFRDHFDYTLLGQTQDDAVGEAFDKVAKIIGLPYPGGPSISKKALEGDANKYKLPKAQLTGIPDALIKLRDERGKASGLDTAQGVEDAYSEPNSNMVSKHSSSATQQGVKFRNFSYDFSFSGLKTAVLRLAQDETGHDFTFPSKELPAALKDAQKADIAATFQRIAIETVVDKTIMAYEEFSPASIVIAGGVAANSELRRQLKERLPIEINYTDPRLCTDNGAMIATLGAFKAKLNQPTADPYSLEIQPNLSM